MVLDVLLEKLSKLFFLSPTLSQNKLVRLSQESFFSLAILIFAGEAVPVHVKHLHSGLRLLALSTNIRLLARKKYFQTTLIFAYKHGQTSANRTKSGPSFQL